MRVSCCFCKTRISVKDPKKLPRGWGLGQVQQGKFIIEFIHCPDHEYMKAQNVWDVYDALKHRNLKPTIDDITASLYEKTIPQAITSI